MDSLYYPVFCYLQWRALRSILLWFTLLGLRTCDLVKCALPSSALHMPVICYQTAASPVLIPLKHPANKQATTVTYSAQSAAWWPAFVVIVGARACDWQLRTRGCSSAETCPKDNIHNVTQQWKWTKQKCNVGKQYPTSYVFKNAICKQYPTSYQNTICLWF